MPRTSVATDNFNRASLGTSDWSQVNTSLAGDVLIDSSTRIRGEFSVQVTDQKCTAKWIGAGTFTDDQYSGLQLTANPTNNGGVNVGKGVCVRVSGTNGTKSLYEAWVDGSSIAAVTYLTKWVSGTRTVLHSSSSVSWAANDWIEIEAEGTTIRVCKNGTALGGSFTQNDSSVTTGAPGVIAAGLGFYGDAWDGGNITSGASVTPVVMRWRM